LLQAPKPLLKKNKPAKDMLTSPKKTAIMIHTMQRKNESRQQRLFYSIRNSWRWLIPGLGVKRWLLMVLAGTTLLGIGLGVLILDIYRNAPDTWWLPVLSAASLRVLERPYRVLIFGGAGLLLAVWGLLAMNRALMAPYLSPGKGVAETLATFRRRERGPRIVALGGGHGLATLLRGLKNYSHNITAVVSVADDGGSSGRLRKSMGILPPGDIRNCLAALSNDEALLAQLFKYRFPSTGGDLDGHSFGNLFISALAEITGSFEEAVAESGRVLAIKGVVLPATLHDVRLVADVLLHNATGEVRVEGESRIPTSAGRVRRVWLEPNEPPAFPSVIKALLSADLILIGPGSLYTSILPNLLVPDIASAVRASRALKVYICNVATQPGETQGYSCGDHVQVIEEHVGANFFDIVVSNQRCDQNLPEDLDWVLAEPDLEDDYSVYRADLVDEDQPWRHDSAKLAQVIIDLFQERTGPLAE
jgi:uncharacterized cofD-like protein